MAQGARLALDLESEAREAARVNRDWQELLERQAREREAVFATVESRAKSLEAAIERAADHIEKTTESLPSDLSDQQDEFYNAWVDWSAPEVSTDAESEDEPLSIYEMSDIEELAELARESDLVR